MPTFKEELIALRACKKAIDWVGNKTFETAWNECTEDSWMHWYLYHTGRVELSKICVKITNDMILSYLDPETKSFFIKKPFFTSKDSETEEYKIYMPRLRSKINESYKEYKVKIPVEIRKEITLDMLGVRIDGRVV